MSAKPIDWTRPLRVVGSHEPVKVFEIEPCLERPVRVGWVRGYGAREPITQWVDRAGWPSTGCAVENIPPEPCIVEMWTAVYKDSNGFSSRYWVREDWLKGSRELVVDSPPRPSPAFRSGEFRIARVLIEEPQS